jgi:beta-glucosidase-like glycosyl hydrolase
MTSIAAPSVDRVGALVAQMTLAEKAAQLLCPFVIAAPDRVVPVTDIGLGGLAWPLSAAEVSPSAAAAAMNAVQARFVEGTRLAIPALFNEEALCGLRVKGATMGPDALGQAATWDPELVEQLAAAYGRQMRSTGIRQVLAPLCDVGADPRWGRVEETYGEDPYLVGTMAAAFVRGIQAPGNVATLKHFIGYAASDGGRNTDASRIGPVELREVHGLPFEMAIRLAGARAVMCSYQAIDRVPVQGSRELLTGLLRDEYGFRGIVISDLGSVEQLHTRHAVVTSREAAVARSIAAGLDLELCFAADESLLVAAVDAGELSEADVDRAVSNVLALKAELGLLDEPYVPETSGLDLDSATDRALALEVARRSVVLLRNEPVAGRPVLPIAPEVRTIAVVGPNAGRVAALLGNYNYLVLGSALERQSIAVMDAGRRMSERIAADAESSDPTAPALLLESVPVVTVLDGIRRLAPAGVTVSYAAGCSVGAPDRGGIAEAVALAGQSDVAIVVVGDQAGIFTNATVGEGVDSGSLELPGVQRDLVEAVAATGTPTVVVLTHGRPYVLGWLVDAVPAIVTGWFPGEEGGTALAEVVFGRTSPSGKTPVSFPRHVGVVPAPYNRPPLGGNTYYDVDVEPVFPFGHGLSYTTFEYSDLSIAPAVTTTDGVVTVDVTVTNTGTVDGAEVVQLYLRDPAARTVRPRRELKGFGRVGLPAGAAARMTFELAAERCAIYDPTEGWVVEPGVIDVLVGSSSQDVRAQSSFELTGPVFRPGRDRVLLTPVTVTAGSCGS